MTDSLNSAALADKLGGAGAGGAFALIALTESLLPLCSTVSN